MDHLDTLVRISLDITSARGAAERASLLLDALRRVIPFDAAALLRAEGDELVPVAARGLVPAALGRRYSIAEHARLSIICGSEGPVVLPADSPLPDPFDGLLLDDPSATHRVHACLGCPLRLHGDLVGAITADARAANAFDGIDRRFLTAVGAVVAAEMNTTRLIAALEEAAERQGLIAGDLMRDALSARGILGRCPAVEALRREIDLVAGTDLSVLVTGETGVGKELVVRAVHRASTRRGQPLIHVNCAALPESLAEAELFGHERGAFTGAASVRAGKLEVAHGGTLFLDEVGELPLSVQPKLLRALQLGEVQRVGADRVRTVDVRLVAATNRDLVAEVAAGRFRADLYHRLAVYPIRVPPLRERAADVPLLAGYFGDLARRRLGVGPVRLDAGAMDLLERYPWPGNVRELENVVSRAVLRASAGVPRGEAVIVTAGLVAPSVAEGPALPAAPIPEPERRPIALHAAVEEFKRSAIRRALWEHGGSWAAAARSLGMDRGNLHRLAGRLGVGSDRLSALVSADSDR